MTLSQLDILLAQVIKARARAERAAHDAKVAGQTLVAVQRQIELAMVKANGAEVRIPAPAD